ncbi:G2/M phase-specific E3 ubiquitin-protein ligase-like [Triplophysa rosa]|uniref:G2/M phase-specific E3 ubiquitin-protein ligase-like n=1 Tax=Triplophysa rosa TaxID=992332 RepID=UPI0025463777|nr:G2/M phase-specific E3 ubiquitin-protein ligase-like [Triplophysa rosa]
MSTSVTPCTSLTPSTSGFYNTYTNIYAPVIIDSSSSDLEDVEKTQEKDCDGQDGPTAADIVSNLAHCLNRKSCNRFNMNRANVWDGADRGFRRSSFDPTCSMLVKFTDDVGLMEEALDTGGPTREFLTLLMDAIETRRVFEGKDNAKYLSFDCQAAEDNEYFHIGRMIAVSIVHGGPGLCCLSPNFFLYLIGKEKKTEATIEDIPDDEVKKALLETLCQIVAPSSHPEYDPASSNNLISMSVSPQVTTLYLTDRLNVLIKRSPVSQIVLSTESDGLESLPYVGRETEDAGRSSSPSQSSIYSRSMGLALH